jgi:hypothetical protein
VILEGQVAEYLLVYYRRQGNPTAWWARWFTRAKNFSHVEIWWELGEGYWVAIRPFHHYLTADVMQGEPAGTVQRVTAMRRYRTPMFPAGLKTCVTVAKAVVGIRNAFVLTPQQLYNYVEKRGGIV